MFRFIFPTFLIGIAITAFFMFTSPLYKDVSTIGAEVSSYNEALNNSKALDQQRYDLTTKYNAISAENLSKLEKLLPDNVDNIKLILEIDKISKAYGMKLKDVKYDSTATPTSTATGTTAPTLNIVKTNTGIQNSSEDFGTWNLEFSTQGSFDNLIAFIKDLESNLRIVDVSSITFSSNSGVGLGVVPTPGGYKYSFKIKTYWLKN